MRRWLIVVAIGVAVALVVTGIQLYRYRFVHQNSDLVRLLPTADLTIIYVDLGLLRKAQLLGLLANIKVAPDQQYEDFIRDTGFDYTRDLDAIVLGSDANRTFMVGRGRFDWQRLARFASSHQGQCGREGCRLPATTRGRWVNLITIQPDVLAVAVTSNPTAADDLRPPGRRLQDQVPDAPVWAKISHSLLQDPASVPLPMRIFAIDLQSAFAVTLAGTQDSLQMTATFPNASAADTARKQLEIQTHLLKTALKNEKPERGSIASVLTAGTFRVNGNQIEGIWPVTAELLHALQ